ncbi:hypothetical protein HLASF_1849 [Halanaeroarchaeum sulfurireducens]|uniref:Uncharacterized protein n=2 Tax=Halanaeroarchaeum sulfurireducens TaxID=1604004 RepID=A0A0F7PDP7_9EURY|nr:DUF5778 family protein [Halanaeroarchaeum sulfurireducens]AKH98320.1 hypothetical protein HLASF_1849 [Halanaeroarchaeum sulfurireducens]ALG82714.1 hypothetical protein HLASA_1835 [Halanaeroarchaeum sulfurireducens]
MTDADDDLYAEAVALLEPGDITLQGVVVHTDFPQSEEPAMDDATRRIGEAIAEVVADEDAYIYAGDDDSRFAAGQFQGRRLSDDEFVWECQQLLRDGTFDLVFYWEATDEQDAVVDAIEDLGFDAVPVTEDGYSV